MSEEIRSAAAIVGMPDEHLLARDVLAALAKSETVSACCKVWRDYVFPVEIVIDPETVDQLGRALKIRLEQIVPAR